MSGASVISFFVAVFALLFQWQREWNGSEARIKEQRKPRTHYDLPLGQQDKPQLMIHRLGN